MRATLSCCGTVHTVVWRRGALGIVDHDVVAERAMIALGAEKPACLHLLDAWRACFSNERAAHLALLQGWLLDDPLDPVVYQAMLGRTRTSGWAMPFRWTRPLMRDGGDAIFERIAVAAMVRCLRESDGERQSHGYVERILDMVASAAVRTSLVEARRRAKNRQPEVEVHLDDWAFPLVEGHVDHDGGHVKAVLPGRWVADVFARGIASVDGCIVLEVADDLGDWLDVRLVSWEAQPDRSCVAVQSKGVLQRDGRAWRVLQAGL